MHTRWLCALTMVFVITALASTATAEVHVQLRGSGNESRDDAKEKATEAKARADQAAKEAAEKKAAETKAKADEAKAAAEKAAEDKANIKGRNICILWVISLIAVVVALLYLASLFDVTNKVFHDRTRDQPYVCTNCETTLVQKSSSHYFPPEDVPVPPLPGAADIGLTTHIEGESITFTAHTCPRCGLCHSYETYTISNENSDTGLRSGPMIEYLRRESYNTNFDQWLSRNIRWKQEGRRRQAIDDFRKKH